MKDTLKVIRLITPEMCASCRFSRMATVTTESRGVERLINCTRLDCDNWDIRSQEPILSIDVDPKP